MFTQIELDMRFWIEPQILPYCGPLFFARSLEAAAGQVTANGSFALVDTGEKKVLVTCQHVWGEFSKLRQDDPALRMLVCLDRNPAVALDSIQPTDQDEKLDIAIFDMMRLLSYCGGRKFYSLRANPPRGVAKGDQLAFAGYPGMFRTATDQGVGFGRVLYGVSVSDVSGLRFAADLSKARTEYVQNPRSDERTSPHGGISGAPCFLVSRNRPARLVGFATSECLNLLWFTHARCLNSNGTINRQLL